MAATSSAVGGGASGSASASAVATAVASAVAGTARAGAVPAWSFAIRRIGFGSVVVFATYL